jgi:autophagy-related protein 18
MIPAHDSPLAAIAFDASGSKLATASEKGTVIRVFSIPSGKRVFEFRRGVRRFFFFFYNFYKTSCSIFFIFNHRNAAIYSLSFSPDSLFLSASSNLETIHIFRLEIIQAK